MPRYSAFVALISGDYREVDWVIEAADPRSAAQHVLDANELEPSDDFPLVLIVEEGAVAVFTRGRDGRVATPTDHLERRFREREGPALHVVSSDNPNASELGATRDD